MTKEQLLETLMLLSALESWSFANKTPLPDYLHERLCNTVEVLQKEVLKND